MAISGLFLDSPRRPAPAWVKGATMAGLLLLLSFLCWAVLISTARSWNVFWQYRLVFWRGWLLTLELACISLVVSTFLGLVAALAKRSTIIIIRYISTIYIEIIRGMPLLVLILVLWYVIFKDVTEGRLFFGILALSLFAGAYMAEIFRAGIESVGQSQRESARAIGLTTWQTYRLIILPQAARHSLPAFTGQLASLIKDSSLLSVLALTEFTYAAQQVYSATYTTVETFLPLAAGYMILTIPISLWSKRLEKTLRYET